MKICVVIQARMSSTRLPGKVLMDLGGQTILAHVIERASLIKPLDHIVVAIPQGRAHEPIKKCVDSIDCPIDLSCVTGDEDNVLERTLKALETYNADVCIRITSDCPFVDPQVSSALLRAFLSLEVSYARLDSDKGYPVGFDTEVVTRKALEIASQNDPNDFEREHVTPYIWKRSKEFPSVILSSTPDRRHLRLVIDELKDYEFAQSLYNRLKNKPQPFTYADICGVLKTNPELLEINQHIVQKAMIGRDDTN